MVAVVNDFYSYYFSYQFFRCLLLRQPRLSSFLFFLLFFVLFCNWFLFIDLACSGNTLTHRRTRAQAQPEAWCDQIRRDPAADFGFGFGFGFGVADTRKFRFFFASLYFIFNYHHAYILFAFYISRASFCIAL